MNRNWLGIPLLAGIALFFFSSHAIYAADLRAAKKEGEVLWYSSLATFVAQPVCDAFTKKIGIKCVLHRSGSGKLYRRYLQEAKGGIFRADVFHTTNVGHFFNMKKKWLKPYRPKGTEKFDPAFRTQDDYWTILRTHLMVPVYNTKKVKEEDVPKSWKDFLDPKWKGRLVNANPNYSGAATVQMIYIVRLFGLDFYEKLAKLKPKIISAGSGIPAFVAGGEADLALGGTSYSIIRGVNKGEPLKMAFPKEGVPNAVSPNSLLKKAPHPNAAKVFIDYLFSLKTQQYLADNGLYVGHPAVKYPPSIPPLDRIKTVIISPA